MALALVIGLLSRRSSSTSVPSHFLDEERASRSRAFTPLTSQELSHDLRSEIFKDFKGKNCASIASSIVSDILSQ